ncbi:MAG: ferritin-like domain-containing protein [Candidatus Omnitrophica bacterium]|nr:ferritin-like domain-containing protein [Candidatus Omnitrophota bacterium]MCF7877322.1 ferritin-like domain-containing protein [Candidatus Omnitrophota bacterium]MCF7891792.1 ferritin-like domain-containing protein [Candidatus Omnitrophota bacterium]MCF7898169.1 ferritin-like domain-containing protein [Candidatus Omnitrophota bacterium]MCF7909155.1 ferritin-like domain-containing protein [Candidatus Omnitrophota bacterium]
MLSKEDYKEHLNQMLELEENMEKMYENLTKRVEDKEIKNIFRKIRDDEQEHVVLVQKMKKIIVDESN